MFALGIRMMKTWYHAKFGENFTIFIAIKIFLRLFFVMIHDFFFTVVTDFVIAQTVKIQAEISIIGLKYFSSGLPAI